VSIRNERAPGLCAIVEWSLCDQWGAHRFMQNGKKDMSAAKAPIDRVRISLLDCNVLLRADNQCDQ
jgi:hypothetical protein